VNIEKLWNQGSPGRGCLGLVELRALRMPPTPEAMVAVAALVRAVAARLAADPFEEPLALWGEALHDRFALPYFLEEDLREVFRDLDDHGFGLGPEMRTSLLAGREARACVERGGATLTVTRALEFWPLVGDVASGERRGARVVDSSTERLQVLVRVPAGEAPGCVVAGGCEVPLMPLDTEHYAIGLRYRTFVPSPGLHPGLAPLDPVLIEWARGTHAVSIALHGWRPEGGAYEALPEDEAEAARRRQERVIVRDLAVDLTAAPALPARPPFTVDLRRAPSPRPAALT
jgi:uncharacterized protein (DUF2126 family)